MRSRLSMKIRSGISPYWVIRNREFISGKKKDHRVVESERMVDKFGK